MHAKLTRDRKKLFTLKMSQMISRLEKQNRLMFLKLTSNCSAGTLSNIDEIENLPYTRDDSPRDTWTDYSSDMQSI